MTRWLLLRIALVMFMFTALLPCAQAGNKGDKSKYVDRKAGFRLQIPPGWQRVKGSKDVLVTVAGPGGTFRASVDVDSLASDDYLAALSANFVSS
jgi:hypothetical protein